MNEIFSFFSASFTIPTGKNHVGFFTCITFLSCRRENESMRVSQTKEREHVFSRFERKRFTLNGVIIGFHLTVVYASDVNHISMKGVLLC